MKKAHYKKSIIALLVVLMYLLIAVAFAKILPLAVLQDLTNSNIKRRILYDAIQAAAVIPFAATYFAVQISGKQRHLPNGYLGGLLAFVPYW